MISAAEIKREIDKLKHFNINGLAGVFLVSTFDGLHGKINFNNNINSVPFAVEGRGYISYHYPSIKFSPVDREWIIENLEPQLGKLLNKYHELDSLTGFLVSSSR